MLAHAMLSLPATKGFEFGSGFGGGAMRGSAHNDPYVSCTDDPSEVAALGAAQVDRGIGAGRRDAGVHFAAALKFRGKRRLPKMEE